MQFKISQRKIETYLCAFAGILSLNPYFVWPTFIGGIGAYLVYLSYIIGICILLKKKLFSIKAKQLLGIFLLILVFVDSYLYSFNTIDFKTILGGIFLFTYLIAYVLSDRETQKDIFVAFLKLFLITLIPGLIYYILEICGISLSIGTLQSSNQLAYENSAEYVLTGYSGYYKLYVGSVMRVNANTRFAGIYDEAGLVGTVAVLGLIARRFDLKYDHISRLLFFFLLVSFSLAGYLLAFMYFFMTWIRRGQWKIVAGTLVLVIGVYALTHVQTNNAVITALQNRIQLTETGISIVNNRETSKFEVGYSELTNGTTFDKLLGFGRGASAYNKYLIGASSYKNKIFDYGYIGFGLMLITLLFFCKEYFKKIWNNNWNEFILICIFFISIYQRPSIYYPYYFILLYGGCSYLKSSFCEKKERLNASS